MTAPSWLELGRGQVELPTRLARKTPAMFPGATILIGLREAMVLSEVIDIAGKSLFQTFLGN